MIRSIRCAQACAILVAATACAPPPVPISPQYQPSVREVVSELSARQYFDFRTPVACLHGPGGEVACRELLQGWTPEHCVADPDVAPCDEWRRRSDQIAALALGAAADPWVIGQGVFAMTRDGRHTLAASLAGSCAAERWWCALLRGHVLYERGDVLGAETVLDSAVSLLPETEACAWSDVGWVLPDAALEPYRTDDCRERWRRMETVWWLTDPAWSRPGNEAKASWLGRMAWAELHDDDQEGSRRGGGSVTDGVGHSRDHHRELLLGVPPEVRAGHAWREEPGLAPRVSVFPAPTAVARPLTTDPGDWQFVAEPDDFRIRTGFGEVAAIPSQISFFERGDSILVVALTEPRAAPLSVLGPVESADLVIASPGDGAVATTTADAVGPGRPLTAMVPRGAYVVGIETTTARGVGRARVGHRLPSEAGAPLRSSDLLLFRAGGRDPSADELGDVLSLARGTSDWHQGDVVGAYLELYGPEELGEVRVTVLLESLDEPGLLRRIGEATGLLDRDAPLEITWTESADGGFAGVWTLDLSDIEPGRYRLGVSVAAAVEGGPARVEVGRELQVRPRRGA